MCGIIGYIGKNNALKVITDGLKQLEYRGYDSAGIAIKNNNEINIFKSEYSLRKSAANGKNLQLSVEKNKFT